MSTWFWEQYTTYGGLWRDQPLWAYTMHHFQATPLVMTHNKRITRGGDLFQIGGTIGWDQHVYVHDVEDEVVDDGQEDGKGKENE
jgi:hypothetical protein